MKKCHVMFYLFCQSRASAFSDLSIDIPDDADAIYNGDEDEDDDLY